MGASDSFLCTHVSVGCYSYGPCYQGSKNDRDEDQPIVILANLRPNSRPGVDVVDEHMVLSSPTDDYKYVSEELITDFKPLADRYESQHKTSGWREEFPVEIAGWPDSSGRLENNVIEMSPQIHGKWKSVEGSNNVPSNTPVASSMEVTAPEAEEKLLLCDIIVVGTKAQEIIHSLCTSASAQIMEGTRSQAILPNLAKSEDGRCHCRLANGGKARLLFWSVVSFNEALPQLSEVNLHSASYVFVPDIAADKAQVKDQLQNLEMRMFEVRMRAKRKGASARMACLLFEDEKQMRPPKDSDEEFVVTQNVKRKPSRRVQALQAWCKNHKIDLIGGDPYNLTLSDGDRLYKIIGQDMAERVAKTYNEPVSLAMAG